MTGPLDGLRVLNLSNTLTGAQVGQFLADTGAEVLQVEPPGGSPLRGQLAYPAWARGTASIELDLKSDDGRGRAVDLVSGADVLIETFRPGAAERLGLGEGDLRPANPRLVYASITGFGHTGPSAHVKGYEGLVMAKLGVYEAFSPMVARPGPAFASVPYCSYTATQTALHGILAALYERERSGVGQKVEASLVQGFAALDTWGWFQHLIGERFPDAFNPVALFAEDGSPNGPFVYLLLVALTADGRWVQFSQVQPHLFRAFMRALDLAWMFEDPEWSTVPVFEDPATRVEFWDRMLTAARTKTLAEWQAVFDADRDVWAEVFRDGSELLHHPQTEHNGQAVVVHDRERGPVLQPGPLVQVGAKPTAPERGAPALDEHAGTRWAAARAPGRARRAPPTAAPLDGVTVLELSALFAAPYGATLLTDLGARVIKIEGMGGDPIRGMVPFPEAGGAKVMQGKESIVVDLATDEGREIVHRFAREADLVLQSFRAGVAERLAVDRESLRAINPSLVYLYAPAYGADGPCAMRPAYAPTIGAGGGIAWRNAGPTIPERADLSLDEIKTYAVRLGAANSIVQAQADGLAALGVATGLLLGLVARARGSDAPDLMTSMMHSCAHALSEEMVEYEGAPPVARADPELFGLSARYRLYEASDGWIFLAAPAAHEWEPLVTALAEHVALDDSMLDDDDALATTLTATFRLRTGLEWERDLTAADVGCVVASSAPIEAMLMSEWSRASGYLADVVHPTFDEHPRLAPLVRLSRSATVARPACLAGQHTDSLLAEFGYSTAEIAALRDGNVVA
jgi:crotonobetainyl-CoA:carnitine CoA-transferase CaiB-like acyl-CoA transferase